MAEGLSRRRFGQTATSKRRRDENVDVYRSLPLDELVDMREVYQTDMQRVMETIEWTPPALDFGDDQTMQALLFCATQLGMIDGELSRRDRRSRRFRLVK